MKNKALFIAHPDDEVLFFTGPLFNYGKDFHVVLVTDGNADGQGKERLKEFSQSLNSFQVDSFEHYQLPDIYDKELDPSLLETKIKNTLDTKISPNAMVYTHGPFGEYGHPHHIQVSNIVHQNCLKKFKISHPNILDLPNSSESYYEEIIYKTKLDLLTSIYKNEFSRFVTLLAPKMSEKHLLSGKETLDISNFLLGKRKSLPTELGGYEYFRESLQLFKSAGLSRRF